MLKTTNIEAERLARRRENDGRVDWEEGYDQGRLDRYDDDDRARRWERDIW